jgi:hypothetical protein
MNCKHRRYTWIVLPKWKADSGHIELVELPDHCQLWRDSRYPSKNHDPVKALVTQREEFTLSSEVGWKPNSKFWKASYRFEAQCGLRFSMRTLQIVGLLGFRGIRMNSVREFVGYHIMVGDWGSARWVAFVWDLRKGVTSDCVVRPLKRRGWRPISEKHDLRLNLAQLFFFVLGVSQCLWRFYSWAWTIAGYGK